MRAKAFLLDNTDEFEEADNLGMKAPEPRWVEDEVLFDINHVTHAFKNNDVDINIYIFGSKLTLVWDKELWNKLEKRFDD